MFKKYQNGITLIALVITIIVLLILAGVTIAMLTGDNGLLNKAVTAKTKSEDVTLAEKLKIAVMTSRIDENGMRINLETLEQELGKYGITGIEKQGENGNLPWKITQDGFIYQITEAGEIVRLNGVSINKTELKLIQGAEETLVATKTEGITGNITWSSSNTDVATVENGKVTAVGASGTAEITASVSGTEYSAKCTVTVSVIGQFAKYDVSYADMYLNDADGNPLTYSATNGWRILHAEDPNTDGIYSNVELISTGIPIKLYYTYIQGNHEWFATNDEIKDFKENILGDDYLYYNGSSTYYALQASAGMYKNLKDIVFRYGTEAGSNYNQGYYKSITKFGTTYGETTDSTQTQSGADLFKVGNVNIRMLTLPEVNDARSESDIDSVSTISTTQDKIGLYRLDQLQKVKGMEQYKYTTGWYWVASPYPSSNNNNGVCVVNYSGGMASSVNSRGGRPVVSLQSDIRLVPSTDGTYYEMQNV